MNKFLTNRQISVMMYSIIIGYGVINISKDVAEAAGTGSWFSLLIATIIFILITYIITYLQYVYEGKTLFEYSEKLVGKLITDLFLIIYLIYFFLFFTMLVRLYSETIGLIILNKTPVIFISIIVFIVIGYALTKGINVIARVCEIYVPINILGTIIIDFLLITKGKFVNLRPLFSTGDIMNYFQGLKATIFPFIGMEILLFIPISRTENKNIFRYTMLMVGFIGILFIYIVESTISVVGVESVIFLKATMLYVLKGVDIYSFDIIRRLDGFYIVIWTMNLVCAMSLWAYGIITIISRKVKSIKYNFSVIIIVCISFIVSQIPKTIDQVQLIIKYNSYFGTVAFFVIPVILFIITKVKKYDKQM
jgi:spore germination protein